MNCRDVRDVADSFLGEELLTETNHEILRHLETCTSCQAELDARRRLRGALRDAFNRATELEPDADFAGRLRDRLHPATVHTDPPWNVSSRWLTLAASLVLAAGVTAAILLNRAITPADVLARDAIGDHRNCALKYRLVRAPVPLEEAAQRFDSAYRLLISTPPDAIPTPEGEARVLERHSCAYGAHRFGHVVLEHRGRIVSLLVTTNDRTAAPSASEVPHLIGNPVDGLSVVSVNGTRHAIMLVGDLDSNELTELARIVSLPLVERLAEVTPDRTTPTAWLLAPPAHELASYSEGFPHLSSILERMPTR